MCPIDFDVIAAEDSPLGMIILRRRDPAGARDAVIEITLDHQFLMSSLNTVSERALSSLAIARHGGEGLHALVGGLGLGYTAHEALASDRVARVDVVELLQPVIDWMRNGLVPLSKELIKTLESGRLEIRQGDVYADLRQAPKTKYDLVLIDVDHSPEDSLGAPNEAFHSASGVALAREHLAAGGVLGVWSCAKSEAFLGAMSSVFSEVQAQSLDFFNPVTAEPETNWVYFGRN